MDYRPPERLRAVAVEYSRIAAWMFVHYLCLAAYAIGGLSFLGWYLGSRRNPLSLVLIIVLLAAAYIVRHRIRIIGRRRCQTCGHSQRHQHRVCGNCRRLLEPPYVTRRSWYQL